LRVILRPFGPEARLTHPGRLLSQAKHISASLLDGGGQVRQTGAAHTVEKRRNTCGDGRTVVMNGSHAPMFAKAADEDVP
jgi:hypothetical protein